MDDGSESVERITRTPTSGRYVAVAAAVVLLVAWVASDLRSDPDQPATPTPSTSTTAMTVPAPPPVLVGDPLEGPTGLELVVGGTLVDVDRNRSTWVAGLDDRPAGESAGMNVFPVGPDTVIVRYFSCDGCGPADVRVLVLRAGATRAEQIVADDRIGVAPGLDGIWIVRHGVDTCTARKLALDGTAIGTPDEIECGWVLRGETPLGLLADSRLDPDGVPIPTTFLLDPTDLSVRFHAHRIVAVAGDRMLVGDGRGENYELRTIDAAGVPFPAPPVGAAERGVVSADGRYVALASDRDPAQQWVADLVEQRWQRVPIGVAPRLVSHAWAADGRLVLFGPLVDGPGDRDATLATWRPGDGQLAVRRVDYPPGQLVVRPSG